MTNIGSFKIEGNFKIVSRELVIVGEIMSGTVSIDNFLIFTHGEQNLKLKIKGVDFVDNIRDKISKIGLTFYDVDNKQIESLQIVEITPQLATITDL